MINSLTSFAVCVIMKKGDMKMFIKIGENKFEISLENNDTVQALEKLLPLKSLMHELNGNEKYVYLDKTLPAKPKEIKFISAGDVMLFGNDCLVLFYQSFKTLYSYTKIGHIDDIQSLQKCLGSGDALVEWN